MDWIERWFGVSPDGSDGTLEFLLILLAITAVVALVVAFNGRARSSFLRSVKTIVPNAPRRH